MEIYLNRSSPTDFAEEPKNRRNNAKCCEKTKIDEGEKSLNAQYSATKQRLRDQGVIGTGTYFHENPNSSCYEQALAVMGGLKIPDCWDCELVNASKMRSGVLDHWWVECAAFGKDGKDIMLKILIFDAYHDRPGGPDPKENRKTYPWRHPVSDDDFHRCIPNYLNPDGCINPIKP